MTILWRETLHLNISIFLVISKNMKTGFLNIKIYKDLYHISI